MNLIICIILILECIYTVEYDVHNNGNKTIYITIDGVDGVVSVVGDLTTTTLRLMTNYTTNYVNYLDDDDNYYSYLKEQEYVLGHEKFAMDRVILL